MGIARLPSTLASTLVVALSFTGALAVARPPVATAATLPTGIISAPPGVLYDDAFGPCTDSTYQWSITADSDWTLQVTVRNGAGDLSSSDFFTSASGAAGTHDLSICDGSGTYSITGELTTTDSSSPVVELPTTTFAMTKAPTRSRIKVSDSGPRPGQRLDLRLRTSQRFRSGYEPPEAGRMRLQGKTPGGHWSYLTGVKPTDSSGGISLHYVWTGKTRTVSFRSVTLPTGRTGRSFSPAVKVSQAG